MESIRVMNVSKSIEGRQILQDVSFSVKQGSVFGYLGPNGAGKTTTLRIMLNLLRPDSGEVLVEGVPLTDGGEQMKRFGVMLENNGLYLNRSARSNLSYFAKLYGVKDVDSAVKETLEMVGLLDRADEKVGKYSKGMKQKIGLARAVIHQPEILFLDEPSSGLDPEAQHAMRELIISLSKKGRKTIFINTHNLDEVQRICDHVGIIVAGRIRACNDLESLRSNFAKPQVEVEMEDDAHAQKAEQLLQPLSSYAGTQRDGRMLVVPVATADSPDLIAFLAGKGVRIRQVRSVDTSLEDIYLRTVGSTKGGA
ncbi:MAG: Trehalose/maltose import ATP-binding protein MalK [Methanomassiliicoccales archaeon PtaU1.Bin124]|nr:MAG: Trehalose/maltose import ATP-binding protein MalK [Methanomassiliicoccales archaeon PtaU1.Bin124]